MNKDVASAGETTWVNKEKPSTRKPNSFNVVVVAFSILINII
jgi:hypothetical protein